MTNEYFTFGAADAFTASIKLADFDRDGDLDGFAVNGRHWARQDFLFFNNGSGRFLTAKAVGNITTGYEPAIFDLNSDGIDDIVIARDRVQSEIFFGKGNGNFADPVAFGNAGPARSVLVADANADRHVDLVVSQRSEKNYIVFGPNFSEIKYFGPVEETVRQKAADLNGDGITELISANLGPEGNLIQYGTTDSPFSTMQRLNPDYSQAVDVDVGDIDGDQLPDLAFAMLGSNVIFLNDPVRPFERTVVFGPQDERTYGISLGDLDNDGDLDIAVANDGMPNAVYLNIDMTFKRVVLSEDLTSRSYGVSIGDLNGDSFQDIVFANSGSMSRIYLNATPQSAQNLLQR